jgi:hypothetical protein
MIEKDPQKVEKILERVERNRKEQVEKILEEIEKERQKAKKEKMNFTAPTKEQLEKKLAKIETPMIIFQWYPGSTSSPGTVTYTVGIHNPDPFQNIWIYNHVFIGPANMVPDVGAALATVDTRFPRLTEPAFPGLTIPPNSSVSQSFTIDVPPNIQPSNYLVNSFVFLADWHDVGEYIDRGVISFTVT